MRLRRLFLVLGILSILLTSCLGAQKLTPEEFQAYTGMTLPKSASAFVGDSSKGIDRNTRAVFKIPRSDLGPWLVSAGFISPLTSGYSPMTTKSADPVWWTPGDHRPFSGGEIWISKAVTRRIVVDESEKDVVTVFVEQFEL